MNLRKGWKYLLVLILTLALLAGCSNAVSVVDESAISTVTAEASQDTSSDASVVGELPNDTDLGHVEKALNKNYPDEAEKIDVALHFNGSNVVVDSEDVKVEAGVVTILKKGTYELTGSYEGQIIVDVPDEDVQLIFNGFHISSNAGSPIAVLNADEVTITLKEGTENTITDGSAYVEEGTVLGDRINGAIYSNDDLAFNGKGSLTIASTEKTGIMGKNDVLILDGSISIVSPRNGIKGNDLVYVNEGSVTIHAGTDGIESEVLVYVDGGTIDIQESYEGIEALDIVINDGVINVVSSDDGINVSGEATEEVSSGFGQRGGEQSLTGHGLTINGGTMVVKSQGDGLDSNGSIWMTGGYVTVYGPESNGNGSLDYNLDFIMDGGSLIAIGSSGMVQQPGSDSSINSFALGFDSVLPAGTHLQVVNNEGAIVAEIDAIKNIQSLIVSGELLEDGGTYKIFVNGTEYTEITMDESIVTTGLHMNPGGPGGNHGPRNGGQPPSGGEPPQPPAN